MIQSDGKEEGRKSKSQKVGDTSSGKDGANPYLTGASTFLCGWIEMVRKSGQTRDSASSWSLTGSPVSSSVGVVSIQAAGLEE